MLTFFNLTPMLKVMLTLGMIPVSTFLS